MKLSQNLLKYRSIFYSITNVGKSGQNHLSHGLISRHFHEYSRDEVRVFASDKAQFKIVDNDSVLSKHLDFPGSNIILNDLECHLSNGKILKLNLTWLRDSCHCSKCTHKFSWQRLFTPKNFDKSIFSIKDIKLTSNIEDGSDIGNLASINSSNSYLKVTWVDGHNSTYSIKWLEDICNLYSKPQIDLKQRSGTKYLLPKDDLYSSSDEYVDRASYWTVSEMEDKLLPVQYEDLIEGFEFHDDKPTFINANRICDMTTRRFNAIMKLCQQLSEFGLAKIVNVPQERNQVLKVARSLAYERPTGYGTVFDVVIEPSEEINLAYSSQEFDLHSDLTYRETSPGVQMLHCIRNSVDGGLSFFSDAFKAADIMKYESPKLFEVLLQYPPVFVVRDPYRDIKFRRQKSIITLDYEGNLKEVYYSPFMLPPVGHIEDLKLFYLAQDKFTQLLQDKENKLITMMEPGDIYIFNNRRVLHGRSSYNPKTSNRFLQGCYMDWDEITCLHEKFHSSTIKGQP